MKSIPISSYQSVSQSFSQCNTCFRLVSRLGRHFIDSISCVQRDFQVKIIIYCKSITHYCQLIRPTYQLTKHITLVWFFWIWRILHFLKENSIIHGHTHEQSSLESSLLIWIIVSDDEITRFALVFLLPLLNQINGHGYPIDDFRNEKWKHFFPKI